MKDTFAGDALVTIEERCETCNGSGHDANGVLQYCRRCGHHFNAEELAEEEAAWEEWGKLPFEEKSSYNTPVQPCGCPIAYRMETDICGDCEGDGKHTYRMMYFELVASVKKQLRAAQRGKK